MTSNLFLVPLFEVLTLGEPGCERVCSYVLLHQEVDKMHKCDKRERRRYQQHEPAQIRVARYDTVFRLRQEYTRRPESHECKLVEKSHGICIVNVVE